MDPSRSFRESKLTPFMEAGRDAFELGLPEALDHASATSPLTGFLG